MGKVIKPTGKRTAYGDMQYLAKTGKAKIGDIYDSQWRGFKYIRVDARTNNGNAWKQIK